MLPLSLFRPWEHMESHLLTSTSSLWLRLRCHRREQRCPSITSNGCQDCHRWRLWNVVHYWKVLQHVVRYHGVQRGLHRCHWQRDIQLYIRTEGQGHVWICAAGQPDYANCRGDLGRCVGNASEGLNRL